MYKWIAILTFFLLIAGGCSSQDKGNETAIEGLVIDKSENRLLIVSAADRAEINLQEQTVEEILGMVSPDAIWISAPVSTIEQYDTGDEVRVTIEGGVNTSYPAQASAKSIDPIHE